MSDPESNSTQPSSCNELHELVLAYIAGALSSQDIERTQRLLNECLETPVSLATYVSLLDAFSSSVPPVTPPTDLHKKLLDQVRARSKRSKNTSD